MPSTCIAALTVTSPAAATPRRDGAPSWIVASGVAAPAPPPSATPVESARADAAADDEPASAEGDDGDDGDVGAADCSRPACSRATRCKLSRISTPSLASLYETKASIIWLACNDISVLDPPWWVTPRDILKERSDGERIVAPWPPALSPPVWPSAAPAPPATSAPRPGEAYTMSWIT